MGKKSIADTVKMMEEGFLLPFYQFLDTNVNTINKVTYTGLYDAVVMECDKNDNAAAVHAYAKKIMIDYCRDKMVKEMSGMKEDKLLL